MTIEQVDIIYKRPNLLLMSTSSLLLIPVCLTYLTENDIFIKKIHEMIILILMNVCSTMRWGHPCFFTCKIDKIMAHLTYIYYSIMGYLMYKKNNNLLFFIMINISGLSLFYLSKITRKKGFHYWYIIHALFHIHFVSFLFFFYYKNKYIS